MTRLALLVACASACAWAAGPALAGQPVTLRPETWDADGVVTLGELFEDAGAVGRTPIATRRAATVVLSAAAVQSAARRAGLDWANAEGLRTVVVRGGAPAAHRGEVEVLSYARSLVAGEIVTPTDLVWRKAAAAPADAPSDAETVIGMAAKRPLRAGAPVSARDLGAAQVIHAGEMITVTFQDAGVALSLQAKALAAAAIGETLNVQNTASKKIIQAVAAGPGLAVVGPAAEGLKTAGAARYAVR